LQGCFTPAPLTDSPQTVLHRVSSLNRVMTGGAPETLSSRAGQNNAPAATNGDGDADADGRRFPSTAVWDSFLGTLEDPHLSALTHRMAFTRVQARQANGHVQGIAAHFGATPSGRHCATVYTSVSDFPPGWGACLIEQAPTDPTATTSGMEAMALPQGRHPGGINTCDGLLAVPMEHDGRDGRVYLYDVGTDPLYPRQVGSFDSSIDGLSWPEIDRSDPTKASAAGIAHLGHGWTAPLEPPEPETAGDLLVVVLSENRYLRFLRFARSADGSCLADPVTCFIDMHGHDGWPNGWIDNVSLVNVDGGWRLVTFSADGLAPGVNLQRKGTTDTITSFELTFDRVQDDRLQPVLTNATSVVLAAPSQPADWPSDLPFRQRRGARERCWPGFRWGASISWTGEEFALFAVEWFGDEQAWVEYEDGQEDRGPDASPPATGGLMYLQFATNLRDAPFGYQPVDPPAHFGLSHARAASKPFIASRIIERATAAPQLAVMAFTYGGKIVQGVTLLALALATFLAAMAFGGLAVRLFFAVVGSMTGLVAVGLISVGVDDRLDKEHVPEAEKKKWGALTGILGAAALGATLWFFQLELPWPTALAGTVALVGFGVGYQLWLRRVLDASAKTAAKRFGPRFFWGFVVASPVLATAMALATNTLVRLAAAAALLATLLVLKFLAWPLIDGAKPAAGAATVGGDTAGQGDGGAFTGWRDSIREFFARAGDPGPLVAVVLAVVGSVLVAVLLRPEGVGAVVIVLLTWLVLASLSVWGAVEYLRPQPTRRYQNWLFGLGVALLVLSFVMTWSAVPDLFVAVLAVGVILTVGLFVVWPGEAGAILVAAAFVLSWAAIDTDDSREPDRVLVDVADGAPTRWVVALGDSFISGEGADTFYEGTNVPRVNVCRRSPTAWPDLVGAHLAKLESSEPDGERSGVAVKSFACSGATIDDVIDQPQHPDAVGPLAGEVPQFEALSAWLDELGPDDEISYVLVSAGGNDAGFAELIRACVLPRASCDDDAIALFEARAAKVESDMGRLLAVLNDVMSTTPTSTAATIVVNPYVDPLGPADGARCGTFLGVGSLIPDHEVRRVKAFRLLLNTRIKSAATEAGVTYNDAGGSVSTNLCGDSGVDEPIGHNWIELQPPDQVGDGAGRSFAALMPSDRWLMGSGHPNQYGHRAIAATVCSLVTEREESVSLPGCVDDETPVVDVEPVDGADDSNTVEAFVGNGDLGRTDDTATDTQPAAATKRWLDERQRDAARWLGVSLALGLLGGVLLGATAAHQRDRTPAARR